MNAWELNIYTAGSEARRLCIGKRACPHGMDSMRDRHWWLAGWNNMDIELAEVAA